MRALALSATDIEFEYGKRFSLTVPRLEIRAGAVTCLVGPSGAGKTTLLKLLALLETPRSGRVTIGSDNSNRNNIAMVLQGAPMWRGTVEDNLRLGLRFAGTPASEREDRIAEALTLLGMAGKRRSPVSTLSGGEAQRVALARALAVRPKIVLLDEPLAHIDEPSKEHLALTLKRYFTSSQTAVLWVTHDRSEALSIGDDLAVVEDGVVLQQGTPRELLEKPNSERVARFLGTDNILNGSILSADSGLASVKIESGAICEVVSDLAVGTSVIVMIRSEDVGLWPTQPSEGSPRNRYLVEVEEVLQLGATVKIMTTGGPKLKVLVTRPTFSQLGLKRGDAVWVGFKTSSARVLRALE